ncbi:nucleosome-remodeling factor subunit NURF301-like isoform X2 [Gordionus sp. m RMFG-2023]|uniref:nucleosome-remodeling factor subunit NURF301-like isoform X2 n=1 Tax=Gordionus sp. m RMFG-2023 TaxID=3053472 RepID=UPI0031FE1D9A
MDSNRRSHRIKIPSTKYLNTDDIKKITDENFQVSNSSNANLYDTNHIQANDYSEFYLSAPNELKNSAFNSDIPDGNDKDIPNMPETKDESESGYELFNHETFLDNKTDSVHFEGYMPSASPISSVVESHDEFSTASSSSVDEADDIGIDDTASFKKFHESQEATTDSINEIGKGYFSLEEEYLSEDNECIYDFEESIDDIKPTKLKDLIEPSDINDEKDDEQYTEKAAKQLEKRFNLPETSRDLIITPYLLGNEAFYDATKVLNLTEGKLLMQVISVYEVLRRFRSVLKLSPFRFETFCAALCSEESNNHLISEVFVSLLKTLLREDEIKNTWYGPQDMKDSINIMLYSLDSVTWPELIKSYISCVMNKSQMNNSKFSSETNNYYKTINSNFTYSIKDKLNALSQLCDLVLSTNIIRLEINNEGFIKHDEACRACHKLGQLICCEACSAVYHLHCTNPPLSQIPDEDWICNICKANQVAGVTDCISNLEKNGTLIRQEPIGYDRQNRKYWYLCRRIIIEGDDQIWYYSTKGKFKLLLELLDAKKYEKLLVTNLNNIMTEIEEGFDITQRITNLVKGNRSSFIEIEEEYSNNILVNLQKNKENEIDENNDAKKDLTTTDSAEESSASNLLRLANLASGLASVESPKDDMKDIENYINISQYIIKHYNPNPEQLFCLGEENGYKTYINQYTSSHLALNKYQLAEERDKKRYLSNKFTALQASSAQEFKWQGLQYTTPSQLIIVLRNTMIHVENKISPAFMHGSWKIYKDKWVKAIQMCTQVKDFAFALAIFECAIRPAVFNNVWHDALGHTQMCLYTHAEREEAKRLRTLKDTGAVKEDEVSDRSTWVKYPKFPRGLPHSVWKMKGEDYRITGHGGWFWLSRTRVRVLQKPYHSQKDPNAYLSSSSSLINISEGLKDKLSNLYPTLPYNGARDEEKQAIFHKLFEYRTQTHCHDLIELEKQKVDLTNKAHSFGFIIDEKWELVRDDNLLLPVIKTEINTEWSTKEAAGDKEITPLKDNIIFKSENNETSPFSDQLFNLPNLKTTPLITSLANPPPYLNSFVNFLKSTDGSSDHNDNKVNITNQTNDSTKITQKVVDEDALSELHEKIIHLQERFTCPKFVAKLFPASHALSISALVRLSLGKKPKTKKVYSKLVVPLGSKFVCKRHKRHSILILPEHEVKRLSRFLNHYFHTTMGGQASKTVVFRNPKYFEVQGFLPSAKNNQQFWPYLCPRPAFKTTWRYRTWTADSLPALALQLKILYFSLQWDEMSSKPPPGGIHTVTSEEEITTTEILKRTEPVYPGQEAKYLVRKIVVPLNINTCNAGNIGNTNSATGLDKDGQGLPSLGMFEKAGEFADLDLFPPERKSLRVKKSTEPEITVEPSVIESWVKERQLSLWQIQLFSDKLDKRVYITQDKTNSPFMQPIKLNNLIGKTSEQIKLEIENQIRQQSMRQDINLGGGPHQAIMLNIGGLNNTNSNTLNLQSLQNLNNNVLKFITPMQATKLVQAQNTAQNYKNTNAIYLAGNVDNNLDLSIPQNMMKYNVSNLVNINSKAQLVNIQQSVNNLTSTPNSRNTLQIKTLGPGQQIIRLPDGKLQLVNIALQNNVNTSFVNSSYNTTPVKITTMLSPTSNSQSLNNISNFKLSNSITPNTYEAPTHTSSNATGINLLTSNLNADSGEKKFVLTPQITQKILRQAILNTTDPSVQGKLMAFQKAHQNKQNMMNKASALINNAKSSSNFVSSGGYGKNQNLFNNDKWRANNLGSVTSQSLFNNTGSTGLKSCYATNPNLASLNINNIMNRYRHAIVFTQEEREANQRLAVAGLVLKSMLDTLDKNERKVQKDLLKIQKFEIEDRRLSKMTFNQTILTRHKQALRKDILKKRNFLEHKLQREIEDEIRSYLFPAFNKLAPSSRHKSGLKKQRTSNEVDGMNNASEDPNKSSSKKRSSRSKGGRKRGNAARKSRKRDSETDLDDEDEEEGFEHYNRTSGVDLERYRGEVAGGFMVGEDDDDIKDEGLLFPLHKKASFNSSGTAADHDSKPLLPPHPTISKITSRDSKQSIITTSLTTNVPSDHSRSRSSKEVLKRAERGKINMFSRRKKSKAVSSKATHEGEELDHNIKVERDIDDMNGEDNNDDNANIFDAREEEVNGQFKEKHSNLLAKVQKAISNNKRKRIMFGSSGNAGDEDYENMEGARSVYCVCKTAYDPTKFYIGCDKCSNWFHGECVNITPKEAKLMDSYVCIECKLKVANTFKHQAKRRKVNHSATSSKSGHHNNTAFKGAGTNQLYCICKQPYNESQFYIGCDRCQDWFHGKCVGILPTEAEEIEEYICPNCQSDKAPNNANLKNLDEKDYEQLQRLVKQLKGHPKSWPFIEPVDSKDAPDYYKVIKEPMDLKKIERKVFKHQYKKLRDFIGDMTKIFDNCRYYNAKESTYWHCAEVLETFFIQKLKSMRKQQQQSTQPSSNHEENHNNFNVIMNAN